MTDKKSVEEMLYLESCIYTNIEINENVKR